MTEYDDGFRAGLIWSHAIAAHMLTCAGAQKSDIVSSTPEYKIGYVEGIINVLAALDAKREEIEDAEQTNSHDRHHLPSQQTQSQSHDQRSDEVTVSGEPAREPPREP